MEISYLLADDIVCCHFMPENIDKGKQVECYVPNILLASIFAWNTFISTHPEHRNVDISEKRKAIHHFFSLTLLMKTMLWLFVSNKCKFPSFCYLKVEFWTLNCRMAITKVTKYANLLFGN